MTVGFSIAKPDGAAKATGRAIYPGDRKMVGALTAQVLFTNQPHARLLSLEVEPALQVPGVIEVITSADVPVNEYGLTMFDQPVLIGLEHTGRSLIPCDVSRWEADHLALVVAETAEAAHQGAAAIRSEWDPLPVVADIDQGIASEVLIHPENGLDTNIYTHLKIRKGDLAAGWKQAVAVVEEIYELPYQEHAFLQPEAGIAYLDEDERITVEVAGQWTVEDQEQIAHALGLERDQIRVIYPAIGGAFGGREDMSLQIVLALAVWKLSSRGIRRPVRCQWSREESIVGHHKRHRGRIETKWGADAEGRIVAVEATSYLDAGPYNYTSNKVLGNLHLCVAGAYEIPNARIDSMTVYTNAVPGGAFRGFGAPQGAFAAENQMNRLAESLGMNPVDIRLRNCLKDGSIGITQTELPPVVTMTDVIKAAASQPIPEPVAWCSFASLPQLPDRIRRGRGFACAYKNVGFSFGFPERCDATVELYGDVEIERAILYHGAADVGQGAHTALVQMAAEAIGIDVPLVEAHFSDTSTAGDSGSASASRLTWMSGNAILGAAEEAQKRWLDGERPARGDFRFVPPPTDSLHPETGVGQPNFAYGYVAEDVTLSVDLDTGHIYVEDVVCAIDVGKAVNPQLVVGQIEGAIVQAHGYALSENLVVKDARIVNPRLSGYLIPGIGDIPHRVRSVILEIADPRGPFGVRGMAEMPLIPYAPAVVAALHDATGVWFNEIPLTPDRVAAKLAGF